MYVHRCNFARVALTFGLTLAALCIAGAAKPAPSTSQGKADAGVASNLYSEAGVNQFSAAVWGALPRVYVPNLRSNNVYVIDPATFKVVDKLRVGYSPQHIVPSWDLQTLWVANNAEGRPDGSLTPIDPKTGKPGQPVMVDDPYNLYFTPDGKDAIVVAEAYARLDFRDPRTMALKWSLPVPHCKGINHADFSADGAYAIFTCEFSGSLAKIDLVNREVVGYLQLAKKAMPQDIRISPDGTVFYVADLIANGVFLVDGDRFTSLAFVATGVGTHGLYPSRDGTKLYITNRGSNLVHGPRHGKGSARLRTTNRGRPSPGVLLARDDRLRGVGRPASRDQCRAYRFP